MTSKSKKSLIDHVTDFLKAGDQAGLLAFYQRKWGKKEKPALADFIEILAAATKAKAWDVVERCHKDIEAVVKGPGYRDYEVTRVNELAKKNPAAVIDFIVAAATVHKIDPADFQHSIVHLPQAHLKKVVAWITKNSEGIEPNDYNRRLFFEFLASRPERVGKPTLFAYFDIIKDSDWMKGKIYTALRGKSEEVLQEVLSRYPDLLLDIVVDATAWGKEGVVKVVSSLKTTRELEMNAIYEVLYPRHKAVTVSRCIELVETIIACDGKLKVTGPWPEEVLGLDFADMLRRQKCSLDTMPALLYTERFKRVCERELGTNAKAFGRIINSGDPAWSTLAMEDLAMLSPEYRMIALQQVADYQWLFEKLARPAEIAELLKQRFKDLEEREGKIAADLGHKPHQVGGPTVSFPREMKDEREYLEFVSRAVKAGERQCDFSHLFREHNAKLLRGEQPASAAAAVAAAAVNAGGAFLAERDGKVYILLTSGNVAILDLSTVSLQVAEPHAVAA